MREPVGRETEAADDEDAIVFLTHEQQLALLACDPERLRAVYAVATYTGARLSELKAVQWQDLDLDGEAPTWTLRRGRKGTTKNRKVRRFKLMAIEPTPGVTSHFANAIEAFKWWRDQTPHGTEPGDLVFPNTKGNRYHEKRDFDWSDKPYTDRKGRARVRLGGKSKALGEDFACTFHQLRHTAASALISGMWGRAWSKPEIQAWMGWQSPAMVER